MTPRDFLDDEDVDLFNKFVATIRSLEKPMQIMLENDFPIRQHYQRFQERKEWIEKWSKVFNLPI